MQTSCASTHQCISPSIENLPATIQQLNALPMKELWYQQAACSLVITGKNYITYVAFHLVDAINSSPDPASTSSSTSLVLQISLQLPPLPYCFHCKSPHWLQQLHLISWHIQQILELCHRRYHWCYKSYCKHYKCAYSAIAPCYILAPTFECSSNLLYCTIT